MDLLQLKYFSELAKRQHLNKTAQEMLVTPSAISSSLARLEKEMGVKLFDRVGRNIRLNNYGKILQRYVDRSPASTFPPPLPSPQRPPGSCGSSSSGPLRRR